MRIVLAGAFLTLAVFKSAWAQSTSVPTTPAPAFEAASVKTSPRDGRGYWASTEGNRVSYLKITVMDVLIRAYQVKDYQIEGPSWIFTEKYDILAKTPDNTPKDRIPAMLQSLLAERLALKLHREMRELSVYELTIGKGPLKLKEAAANGSFGIVKGHREARGMGMRQFVAFLTLWLGRPVLDKTGLTSSYDFKLEISREEAGPAGADKALLSIFTSLQEIGLKLEPRKDPVEMVVVDGGTKTPTEN
jgi:uncharacterized protein (TIGR03435 family)